MNTAIDHEQLLMDALDGTLDASGTARLQAYLTQHTEVRDLFERIQEVDRSIRTETCVAAPAQLSVRVMDAVARVQMLQPVLRAPQIAFLIITGSAMFMMSMLTLLLVYTGFSPAFPFAELNTLNSLAMGLAAVVFDVMNMAATILHVVISQPITWVIAVIMFLVVGIWLRVMVAILTPHSMSTSA